MTKTVAELQSELDRLDAEIRTTREQEVGGPLDQITELMAHWSISLDQVAWHFRHRFGMEASDTSLRRTGDSELTAFLTRAIGQILSDDPAPPSCPRCASDNTWLVYRSSRHHPVPTFCCDACNRTFTRLHGTSIQNLKNKEKLFEFLPYLAHQHSLDSVAAEMHVTRATVTSWLRRVRALLWTLDPSGHYVARVRLGQRHGRCER
ncbi:DUF746 domain-containing protein [Burkholderia catarinensis]|uniref:DUF746 domain-containing protein n=1 Tax=Burkholderia catarinensis TaxID=1108140 RepID=UPI000A64E6A9|nr:DUF746 domain-containing protein [Burkholderia catarinensis]KAG8155520.1 hypothetical protein BFF94_002895 [Burkholderia catarinensis]